VARGTGDPGTPEDATAEPGAQAEQSGLKPSAMRGNEVRYGYMITAGLIGIAIANLVDTHGQGAPTHPNKPLEYLGLALCVGLLGLLQTRNRVIVGFGTVVALYVVELPKTPTSLTFVHLAALIIGVAYAFIMMQRMRKATLANAPNRRRRAQDPTPDKKERKPRRGAKPAPAGPQASSRYTPPKAKRVRR
jgi:hypothetical protein